METPKAEDKNRQMAPEMLADLSGGGNPATVLHKFLLGDRVWGLAVSPNQKMFATVASFKTENGTRVFSLPDCKIIKSLDGGPSSWKLPVAFSFDSRYLVGYSPGTNSKADLIVYDTQDNFKRRVTIENPLGTADITTAEFHPRRNDEIIASAGPTNAWVIYSIDVEEGKWKEVKKFTEKDSVHSVHYEPGTGRRIAVANRDASVSVYLNSAEESYKRLFRDNSRHSGDVQEIKWSQNGQLLFSLGESDGRLCVFSTENDNDIQHLRTFQLKIGQATSTDHNGLDVFGNSVVALGLRSSLGVYQIPSYLTSSSPSTSAAASKKEDEKLIPLFEEEKAAKDWICSVTFSNQFLFTGSQGKDVIVRPNPVWVLKFQRRKVCFVLREKTASSAPIHRAFEVWAIMQLSAVYLPFC